MKSRSLVSKLIAFSSVAIIVIGAASGYIGYLRENSNVYKNYITFGSAYSHQVGYLVDGDNIEDLRNHRDEDEYEFIQHRLDAIYKTTDLKYAYVIIPDLEKQTVEVLFLVSKDPAIVNEMGRGAVTSFNVTDEIQAIYDGKADSAVVNTNNKYGNVLTIYTPIMDSSGNITALAAVDMSMERMDRSTLRQATFDALLIAFVLMFAFGFFLLYFTRTVIRPVKLISNRMLGFVSHRGERFEPVKIKTGDELQQMAKAFNSMAEDIDKYVADLSAMTSAREKINAELDVASRIQTGFLPDSEKFASGSTAFSLSAVMRPAKEVGGDFYDFFMTDDSHLCTVIGDVSGKGVGAAMFMVVVKTLLYDFFVAENSPAQALKLANDRLVDHNPQGMFVTVFAGILDLETGEYTFSNAGHNPPVIMEGDCAPLSVSAGTAIGIYEGETYTEERLTMKPGDRLFLYTDGVTEALSRERQLFGEDRLLSALRRLRGRTCRQSVYGVLAKLSEFSQGAEQWDDITMLALSYDGKNAPLIIPARTDRIGELKAYIQDRLSAAPELFKPMCLAAEEIFVNIASYAYENGGGEVSVLCFLKGDAAELTFIDWGTPFDPLSKLSPDTEAELSEREPGGLGIFLTNEVMDEMSYTYSDGRNILTMTKNRGAH